MGFPPPPYFFTSHKMCACREWLEARSVYYLKRDLEKLRTFSIDILYPIIYLLNNYLPNC